jgi:antagonist of KipI
MRPIPDMTAAIRVVVPGLQTTVQDTGRWGFQSRGIPVAGPVDPVAHRLANALVGNPPDSATLEITLVGPELEFEDERVVAVAGARFRPSVDGLEQQPNHPFIVRAGARFRTGERLWGTRAYVGIEGGVDVPVVLGSRATHVRSRMGGFHGRALEAGDRLPLRDRHDDARRRARVLSMGAVDVDAPAESPARVRVLPGPQLDRFADDALDMLQSGPYIVSKDSDRMGFRLVGPRLRHVGPADVISDATPLGSLQVPASGQPVLLMADRQTTGGYAKVATVIAADITIAAQLGPGDALVFRVCSPREALSALVAQERKLMKIEETAAS